MRARWWADKVPHLGNGFPLPKCDGYLTGFGITCWDTCGYLGGLDGGFILGHTVGLAVGKLEGSAMG